MVDTADLLALKDWNLTAFRITAADFLSLPKHIYGNIAQ